MVRKTYLLLKMEPQSRPQASGELLNGLRVWTSLPEAPGSPALRYCCVGSSPSVKGANEA